MESKQASDFIVTSIHSAFYELKKKGIEVSDLNVLNTATKNGKSFPINLEVDAYFDGAFFKVLITL